jgi:hypothetical protein
MADKTITTDRRLWLTEDKSKVVEDGDPAARWLWSPGPGHEVSKEEADSVGYKPQKGK